MSQEKTEAVVLRGVDFSESSRIVTFLTPDRGKLACMARGVKRPKNQLAALLDTFNRLELVYYWKDSRSVQQLGDTTLLNNYDGIKTDLDKVTYAAFPLEIAYKVSHENEPSMELYATLLQGLDGLAQWHGDIRLHVSWQVLQLLNVAGYEPSMECCVDCGRDVEKSPGFAYRGGVTCPACRTDRKLSNKDYEALMALATDRDKCPDINDGPDVFGLLRTYASNQLDTSFRSVRVIDQMFG